MAKRKINAAILMAAGEDAHLQTSFQDEKQNNNIDGEVFMEVPVTEIVNNPMQPRININDEELIELAQSIKEHGLIHPISVIKKSDDSYMLKAGQRRWLAHKLLKLKKVKAIVEIDSMVLGDEKKKQLFEIAIIENTQRDNLDPLEFALSIQNALTQKLYKSMEEIANKINKSKSYVSKVIKVLSLEEEILEDLFQNKSTNDIETLYELQKIKDTKKQIKLYFEFINKDIDRAGIRKEVQGKVSHAKQDVVLKRTAKKLTLNVDLNKLSDDKKNELEQELTALLKKYV
jgi:ParB family chromosome partitioning protein